MLKFKEEKKPGLLGLTVVFTLETIQEDPFRIQADSGGVKLSGTCPRLSTRDDFESLAQAIGKAASQYNVLRKDKVLNVAGH